MSKKAVLTFIHVSVHFPFANPVISAQQIAGDLLHLITGSINTDPSIYTHVNISLYSIQSPERMALIK